MKGKRAALLLAIASTVSATAYAAPRRERPKAAQNAGLSLEEVAVMMSSSNPDELRMALEGAASLGSADVIPLLQERVRAGLPPELLDTAIDAVTLIGDPSAGDLLAGLARHRRPGVRLKAVQALVTLRAPQAGKVLSQALSDGAPDVREAAASGLGDLGEKSAVERLFLAFDRNVASASRALGKLVGPDQLPKLLAYVGRVPLNNLTPTFDALLTRRDLPEGAKLKVVATLEELATAEARGYLEGLGPRLPADTSPKLRKAIDDAVLRIKK